LLKAVDGMAAADTVTSSIMKILDGAEVSR
jgi:hypothetical protein